MALEEHGEPNIIEREIIQCLVVGDEGVGKSALCRAVAQVPFQQRYVPTTADYEQIHLDVKYAENSYPLRLTELTKKCVGKQRFFEWADVVVVVYSIVKPETFSSLYENWIKNLADANPNLPFVVVGTHEDVWEDDAMQKQLKKKKVQPLSTLQAANASKRLLGASSFLECSPKTGKNITQVFKNILSLALKRIQTPTLSSAGANENIPALPRSSLNSPQPTRRHLNCPSHVRWNPDNSLIQNTPSFSTSRGISQSMDSLTQDGTLESEKLDSHRTSLQRQVLARGLEQHRSYGNLSPQNTSSSTSETTINFSRPTSAELRSHSSSLSTNSNFVSSRDGSTSNSPTPVLLRKANSTSFITLSTIQMTLQASESECFGFRLNLIEGKWQVIAVTPGSPANIAGIEVGDSILSANQTPIFSMSKNEMLTTLYRYGGIIDLEVQKTVIIPLHQLHISSPNESSPVSPVSPLEDLSLASSIPLLQNKSQINDTKSSISTNEDSGLCTVCIDKKAEMAVIPCGHMCLCVEDASSFQEEHKLCPVCRATILSIIRIYST